MVKPETARLIRHAIPVQRFCQRCVSISFHRVVLVGDTPGMFLECPSCGALDILDPAVGHGLVWHGLPPALKQEYDAEAENRKHTPALQTFGQAELGRIRAAVVAFPELAGQVQKADFGGQTTTPANTDAPPPPPKPKSGRETANPPKTAPLPSTTEAVADWATQLFAVVCIVLIVAIVFSLASGW